MEGNVGGGSGGGGGEGENGLYVIELECQWPSVCPRFTDLLKTTTFTVLQRKIAAKQFI